MITIYQSELKHFSQLQFNWDGNDSLPISADTIDLANQYLSLLHLNWPTLPKATLSPEFDGGIAATWTNGNSKAILFIGETTICFAIKEGTIPLMTWPEYDPQDAIEIPKRFASRLDDFSV